MLHVCCVPSSQDEYFARVKTGNECQLSANMLLLGKFATVVCCAEVLFQPSFFDVVSTLHAEWSTERTTEPLHRLSAFSRDFATPHLWIAVCIRSALVKQKSVSPQHPCIDSVPSCVVVARVARTILRGSWVHTSRMVAELLVILRRSTAIHHDDH